MKARVTPSAGAFHRRRWLLVACAVMLSTLCAACMVEGPGLPPSRDGRVLWTGDAESGDLSQFDKSGADAVGGNPARVVTDPVRDGKYALSLTIPGASKAPDVVCCGPGPSCRRNFAQSSQATTSTSVSPCLLEPGFPTDARWQSIFQLKQNFNGSPRDRVVRRRRQVPDPRRIRPSGRERAPRPAVAARRHRPVGGLGRPRGLLHRPRCRLHRRLGRRAAGGRPLHAETGTIYHNPSKPDARVGSSSATTATRPSRAPAPSFSTTCASARRSVLCDIDPAG